MKPSQRIAILLDAEKHHHLIQANPTGGNFIQLKRLRLGLADLRDSGQFRHIFQGATLPKWGFVRDLDSETMEQAISWCKKHGVDHLIEDVK
ncbi:hypothetical protein [Vibrio phage RYC]|nr:hypothetical protein [Vibrio phage RYC]